MRQQNHACRFEEIVKTKLQGSAASEAKTLQSQNRTSLSKSDSRSTAYELFTADYLSHYSEAPKFLMAGLVPAMTVEKSSHLEAIETPHNPSANVPRNRGGRTGMDELERSIGDLVIANRILAKEDVVDAYGHVSIRHPQQAGPLSAVALAQPGVRHPRRHHRVQARRHSRSSDSRPPYLERFIHGAIYEARPDVNAVVHSHAEDMLPFSISKTPMCCVAHVASDMGTPRAGVGYRRQVRRRDQSAGHQHGAGPRHGARCSARTRVVLMRGHGFSAAADGLLKLVRMSVYLPRNARILLAAMRMGEFKALSEGEIKTRNNFRAGRAGNAARLGVLGAAAPAAATCWRAARAGCEPWPAPRRIDVHFHLIPQFYAEVVYAAGSRTGDRPLSGLVAELALETMDRFDIATALTSLGQPGVQFCKPRPRPRRWRAAATIMPPSSTPSMAEALRRVRHGVDVERATTRSRRSAIALDTLKFAGVSLFASYDGKFLGDPQFDPVMEALNARDARGVRASRRASDQQADRPAVAGAS